MRRTVTLIVVLCSIVLAWLPGLPGPASWAQAGSDTSLVRIEKKSVTLENFRLESGSLLPQVTLAYEMYGALAPDGRNAILITHGYTNSQHAAGRYAPSDATPGWWDRLIGPGKAIDTRRFFVVSSNMLGSSYGSTGPASLNPATGKPYGPAFPDITLRDIVTAQHALLTRLGVTHLIAVMGPSYGGLQVFLTRLTSAQP